MEQTQKWYQSWVSWLALAALIVYVVRLIWHVDISETVDGLMNVLLPVLIGFGIINNPNTKGSLGYKRTLCTEDVKEAPHAD